MDGAPRDRAMVGDAGVVGNSVFIREVVVGIDDADVLFVLDLVSHDGMR